MLKNSVISSEISSLTDCVVSYRYGFNGKENDGETGTQDYGFRIYNPAIAKFLSVDPLTAKYPELTPYQFASNTPIQSIDLDGLEMVPHYCQYMGSPEKSLVMLKNATSSLIFKWNNSVKFEFGEVYGKAGLIAGTSILRGIGTATDKYGYTFFRYETTFKLEKPSQSSSEFHFGGGAAVSIGFGIDTKSKSFQSSWKKTPAVNFSFFPVYIQFREDYGYYGIGFSLGYEVSFNNINTKITQSYSLSPSDMDIVKPIKSKMIGVPEYSLDNKTNELIITNQYGDVSKTGILMQEGEIKNTWESKSYIENKKKDGEEQ
ncbi:MAG: RHS repeat-associated core domain-containing protein [Bacteroidota bacterium]